MQRKDFLLIIGSTAIVLLLAAGGLGLLFWQHARAGGFALRSEDAPLYLNEARDRMARREYAGALEIYTRAIEADPTLVASYLERANAHEILGDARAAADDYHTALGIEPDNTTALHALARLFYTDHPELALDFINRALEANDRDLEARQIRASLRMMIGDDAGALDDLRTIMQTARHGPETMRDAAWAHWGLGDYDAALAEFDRAVQADTRALHSFFGRGATFLLLDRLEEALWDLREAAVLGTGESDYPRLYLWIARARLAGTNEADVELRAAVDQDRFMSAWALTIARFLLDDMSEKEFLDEAQLTFRDLTTAEKNCEAWYYAAAKRAVGDDEDGAVALFKACLATGVRNYYEYHSALAELRQRGLAPASASVPDL